MSLSSAEERAIAAAQPSRDAEAPPRSRRRALARGAALFLLVFAVAALPLATVRMPPVFDYPNHLARVDAILRFGTDPAIPAFYELSGFAIPNVLSDLVLLALMALEGPDAAGRHLLAITFVLTLGGFALLGRAASGRFSPWTVLTAVFLTNEMFFWGFLNYNLGIALLPWGLAGWLALRKSGRTVAAIAAGAAFSVLIFFAHFVAFALYGVGIGILELVRAFRPGRIGILARLGGLLLPAVQFVPALLIYWTVSPSGRLPLDLRFDYSVWGKFSPFARVLSSGNPDMDTPMLVGVLVLALLAVVGRIARVHPGILLVALVYAGLALTLPFSALGSYFLDARIVSAAALMATAALVPRGDGGAATTAVFLVLLALLGYRSLVLVDDWGREEDALARVRSEFRVIPEGAVLVAGSARPFELGDWRATRRIRPAHEHTAAYAAIDRHAIVPTLFARRGQNPLVYTPASPHLKALERNPIPRLFQASDYAWLVGPAAAALAEQPRPAGIYAVAFHAPCDAWPDGLPVRRVSCAPDFSIMQVLPRAAPPPETTTGDGR